MTDDLLILFVIGDNWCKSLIQNAYKCFFALFGVQVLGPLNAPSPLNAIFSFWVLVPLLTCWKWLYRHTTWTLVWGTQDNLIFQILTVSDKNIRGQIFEFSDKKQGLVYSVAQGENYPTRPRWIMIAFHIGTHVYMTLGICHSSLGKNGQNVQGPH